MLLGHPLAMIPRPRPELVSSNFLLAPLKKTGNLPVGVDEYWSDDDLGIEDDDEFQKKKAVHDKKKRQAEKVGCSKIVWCVISTRKLCRRYTVSCFALDDLATNTTFGAAEVVSAKVMILSLPRCTCSGTSGAFQRRYDACPRAAFKCTLTRVLSFQVYEARLAALLAARNDRKDEHKRAQERYKKVRAFACRHLCSLSEVFGIWVSCSGLTCGIGGLMRLDAWHLRRGVISRSRHHLPREPYSL